MNKKDRDYIGIIAYVFALGFTIASILVSLNRFWQYEVFYYDFGIFDRAIWEVSRFQAPIIDHLIVGGKWIFADHFSPSIFLLSPFYWITQRSEMLLIMQAVIVGVSGLVLYKIGTIVLKQRLLPLSILVCYFMFVGLQNAIVTDFHELTVMTLPLMLTFWAAVKKKAVLYSIFLLITLGFKEVTFLVGIGIGITVLLLNRKWLKIGLTTILISSVWGLVSIKFIIPYFSNGIYLYAVSLPSGILDKVYALADHAVKQQTLFYSFLSFGFLPLGMPWFWFLIIQDYALRFIPPYFSRWGLGFHYNAQSAVILALASVFSLKVLLKSPYKRLANIFAILLIFNAIILYQFILHGPLGLSYNKAFYTHTKNFLFLDKLVKSIPREASIMTQNNLAPHFTHQKVWLLRENYEVYTPDYIMIDIREGQNPNNFYGTDNINNIFSSLMVDTKYEIMHRSAGQYIFRRKG